MVVVVLIYDRSFRSRFLFDLSVVFTTDSMVVKKKKIRNNTTKRKRFLYFSNGIHTVF